tara:strand:+ start:138 stop:1274 length:1137 start_codon:yes stop_codon:yes gene_type:complete
MANGQMINLGGNLPPEILQQQQALNRQQQMAQLLMQQGMQQPQGQMVSGRYVAPSFFQYAAPLAQLYAGKRISEKGDEAMIDLAEQLRKGKEQETQAIMEQLRPRNVQTEMAGPYTGNIPMPTATQTIQPNVQNAMSLALQSRYGAGKELLPTLIQRSLPEPIKPTTDIQNFEFAKSQGFKGSFNDYKQQITPVERERLNLDREKFEFDKQTKASGKDLTESQGKASAFQSQMVSASNAVNNLEAKGFDPTSFRSQTAVKLAGGVANPAIPVAAQQYKQAQDQWSEAYLRFKTGAAATEPEVIRNNRTFFPVFGDKPDQIAQKAAAREQAERDIGIAAGRGAGLGAQPITPTAKPEAKPTGMPSQSAIDAELKRRGLK